MKKYDLDFEKIEKAFNILEVVDNLKSRMNSIKCIIENAEELKLSEKDTDILYLNYEELEKELLRGLISFSWKAYELFESYDKNIKQMILELDSDSEEKEEG